MTTGVVPGPVDSASAPLPSGCGTYLSMQNQASYHSASLSPSARRPSSDFDGFNKEANVRANATVVDGHANVCAISLLAPSTSASTLLALHFSLHSPPSPLPSPLLSFCCCWGAHLRSKGFHYHNHIFPLFVVVL